MAFNAENYKKIAAKYQDKNLRAKEAAEARRNELHMKFPEIAEIDRALSTTGIRIMQESLKGREGLTERIHKLEEGNNMLLEARRDILRQNGYPEDYSSVHYDCDLCMDTGFVNGKMCKCLKKELVLAEYEHSGILNLIQNQNFDTFDLSYYNDNERVNMERIFARLKTFATKFDGQHMQNFLLMGTTGLGKTHLSSAVAKEVIDNGYNVVYESAQKIFDNFETERFSRNVASGSLTNHYFDCDLLIMDDLGVEMETQFTISALYNLINTRLVLNKSMMISTNVTKEELLARYTDRITSRLFGEFETYVFSGKDVRLQKLLRK